MFDIGIGEVLALGVIGLLVFGPDKLPGAAADAVRLVRQARGALRGTASLIEETTGVTAADVREQIEQINTFRPQSLAQSLWSDSESIPESREPESSTSAKPDGA